MILNSYKIIKIRKMVCIMKRLLVVLSVLLVFFSCGKEKDSKGGVENIFNSKKSNSETSVEAVKKYNGYVDIYNQVLRIDEEFMRYFKDAGNKEQLNKYENPGIGFNTLNQNFINKMKEQAGKAPKMEELDKSSLSLAGMYDELLPVFQEAESYYKSKEFLSDNYAKGQEIHKKILEGFKKYNSVVGVFITEFNKKSDEVFARELEMLKKEGRMIGYNRALTLNTSKKILDELDKQKLSAANVTEGNAEKIKQLNEELGKALTELQNSVKDPKLLKKEGYEGGEADSYIDQVLEFKGAVAALINRIENKIKVDEFRLKNNFPMENEEGAPEQVYDIYDDVINEYNRLNRK